MYVFYLKGRDNLVIIELKYSFKVIIIIVKSKNASILKRALIVTDNEM